MYQYQYRNHFLQNFHTGVMIFYVMTMVFLASTYSHPLFLAGLLLSVYLLALLSGESKKLLNSLKWILPMVMMIVIINAVSIRNGGTVLWSGPRLPVFGRIEISLEAILYGLNMSLRLLVIMWEFLLMAQLIDPDRSLTVFSRVLEKSAITVSLATRMIPILSKRLKEVMEVQAVRGIRFHDKSRLRRIKNTFPLIKVMFLSLLEDTFKNAEAMYARGYGVGKRSYYCREIIRPRDWFLLTAVSLLWAAAIFFMVMGWSDYNFYPHLQSLMWSKAGLILFISMMFLIYFPAIMSWGCKKWPSLQQRI